MACSTLAVAVATGLSLLLVALANAADGSGAGMVLELKHKFAGRTLGESMIDRLHHDRKRHSRMLFAVDVNLGAKGFQGAGLFYAKVMIGKPAKAYFPILDTSTDLSWVYCSGCKRCPAKSSFGYTLTHYDAKASSASKKVTCEDSVCSLLNATKAGMCAADKSCNYKRDYDDGSSSKGHLVQDVVLVDAASGNNATTPTSGDFVFGCGVDQYGALAGSAMAFDGELGFGRSNLTLLSQLVSQKLVKNTFAHCFDSKYNGGIFAIGEVAQQKITKTPFVPDALDYQVRLKGVDLGGKFLDISDESGKAGTRIAMIDSATTYLYFPEALYQEFMDGMKSARKGLKFTSTDPFLCFLSTGSVDDDFPVLKFHFVGSLKLALHPHEYLFETMPDTWCIGVLSSAAYPGHEEAVIIGENAFVERLVVYDLDKQEMGWTDYNCSTGVTVKDDKSGNGYTVVTHNTPLAATSAAADVGGMTLLLVLSAMLSFFTF